MFGEDELLRISKINNTEKEEEPKLEMVADY